MQTAANKSQSFTMDVWMTMTVQKIDKLLWWKMEFRQTTEQMICVVVDVEKGQIGAEIVIKIFQNNILHFH